MSHSSEAKTHYLKLLSPDLIKLNEEAERFVENAQFKKAIFVYKKIEEFLNGDEYVSAQIQDLGLRVTEGPVADLNTSFEILADVSSSWVSEMMRSLEIEEIKGGHRGLDVDLAGLEQLEYERFSKIALDAAVFAGLSENWQLSLSLVNRLLEQNAESMLVRLWRLRCLVELEMFAEAVALFLAQRWPSALLIHANFLVGLSYEGLGVREQAKSRFEAVSQIDPDYRKVSQKLLNY